MVGTVSQCVPVYPSVTLDTPGHFRHHQTPELWLAPIRVYCLSCHLPMITSHPIIIITTALLVSMLKDPVWLCDCVSAKYLTCWPGVAHCQCSHGWVSISSPDLPAELWDLTPASQYPASRSTHTLLHTLNLGAQIRLLAIILLLTRSG